MRVGASILSGMLIGIACMASISAGGGVLGALFFPAGLIAIILLGLPLYTGRIGYISGPQEAKGLAAMLLLNMIGAEWVGLAYRLYHGEVSVIAQKLAKPLDALLCGILIYAAVEGYRRSKSILAILFPIAAFVLIGAEHCVADAFYLAAGISAENILYSLLWLAAVVAGNTAGAIILNAVSREENL